MSLVEWIRLVSAVLGFMGAAMIAPEALPMLWKESVLPGGRRLLIVLQFRKPLQPASGSARGTVTASRSTGWAVGSQPRISATDGSWQAELAVLRAELRDIEERLTERNARTNQAVAELRAELQEARRGLQTDLAGLHSGLSEIAQQDARFNSAGLPVIGSAFVLGGIPESWLDRWYLASFWLLLAAVLTGAALWRFWKLRHAGRDRRNNG